MLSRTGATIHEISLARIYGEADGKVYRVLVDRLWPRGVSKAVAALDEWLKDVAPSADLRRWYGHQPERFEEFAERYRAELIRPPARDAVDHLLKLAAARPVVLLTATRNLDLSGGHVLFDHLAMLQSEQGLDHPR